MREHKCNVVSLTTVFSDVSLGAVHVVRNPLGLDFVSAAEGTGVFVKQG